MRLKLVPSETSFDFMRLRISALGFSGLLVAASILMFTFVGLNLGIDFRGGANLHVTDCRGAALVQDGVAPCQFLDTAVERFLGRSERRRPLPLCCKGFLGGLAHLLGFSLR